MIILGDGFGDALVAHEFEGHTIGQAQSSLSRLHPSGFTETMERFVDPCDSTMAEDMVAPLVRGDPSKPVLNQGDGFQQHIIRGHETPRIISGPSEELCGLCMKGIARIKVRIEAGSIDEDRSH